MFTASDEKSKVGSLHSTKLFGPTTTSIAVKLKGRINQIVKNMSSDSDEHSPGIHPEMQSLSQVICYTTVLMYIVC